MTSTTTSTTRSLADELGLDLGEAGNTLSDVTNTTGTPTQPYGVTD